MMKIDKNTCEDFWDNQAEKMIQLAKNNQNTSSAYSNVKYIQDKAQSFLVNNKFDLIYLSSVMQYLADDDIRMMIKHVKQMSHDETVLLTRDSVSILNDSFCKEGDYPVIYRTLADYNKLLNAEGFFMKARVRSFFKPYLTDKLGLNKILSMPSILIFEKMIGQTVARYKELIDTKIRNKKKTINHIFHVYEIQK